MILSHEDLTTSLLEEIMRQDENIESAIMFGRGKFLAGVIITPTSGLGINAAEFKDSIWYVSFLDVPELR